MCAVTLCINFHSYKSVYLPACSINEFSTSEVWMIVYKLPCCINISFQHPLTVMHSAIKLVDLRETHDTCRKNAIIIFWNHRFKLYLGTSSKYIQRTILPWQQTFTIFQKTRCSVYQKTSRCSTSIVHIGNVYCIWLKVSKVTFQANGQLLWICSLYWVSYIIQSNRETEGF